MSLGENIFTNNRFQGFDDKILFDKIRDSLDFGTKAK